MSSCDLDGALCSFRRKDNPNEEQTKILRAGTIQNVPCGPRSVKSGPWRKKQKNQHVRHEDETLEEGMEIYPKDVSAFAKRFDNEKKGEKRVDAQTDANIDGKTDSVGSNSLEEEAKTDREPSVDSPDANMHLIHAQSKEELFYHDMKEKYSVGSHTVSTISEGSKSSQTLQVSSRKKRSMRICIILCTFGLLVFFGSMIALGVVLSKSTHMSRESSSYLVQKEHASNTKSNRKKKSKNRPKDKEGDIGGLAFGSEGPKHDKDKNKVDPPLHDVPPSLDTGIDALDQTPTYFPTYHPTTLSPTTYFPTTQSPTMEPTYNSTTHRPTLDKGNATLQVESPLDAELNEEKEFTNCNEGTEKSFKDGRNLLKGSISDRRHLLRGHLEEKNRQSIDGHQNSVHYKSSSPRSLKCNESAEQQKSEARADSNTDAKEVSNAADTTLKGSASKKDKVDSSGKVKGNKGL